MAIPSLAKNQTEDKSHQNEQQVAAVSIAVCIVALKLLIPISSQIEMSPWTKIVV